MTIIFLNVTKNDLTETQKDAGCVDFASQEKEELRILLSSLDSKKNNRSERNEAVTKIAEMTRREVMNLYQQGAGTFGIKTDTR